MGSVKLVVSRESKKDNNEYSIDAGAFAKASVEMTCKKRPNRLMCKITASCLLACTKTSLLFFRSTPSQPMELSAVRSFHASD